MCRALKLNVTKCCIYWCDLLYKQHPTDLILASITFLQKFPQKVLFTPNTLFVKNHYFSCTKLDNDHFLLFLSDTDQSQHAATCSQCVALHQLQFQKNCICISSCVNLQHSKWEDSKCLLHYGWLEMS